MNSNLGKYKLVFKPFGESGVLIEWPKKIDKNILTDIREFVHKNELKKIKYIIDINFVYSSLLIIYDNNLTTYKKIKNVLLKLYDKTDFVENKQRLLWNIPVCYNTKFGIDLQLLASEKKCTINDIIDLHSSINYTVYGIGFLPGFLYLGGLPEKLQYPRKSIPRLNVSKGAVAIGGDQTGVYPQNSPGGWNIIGKTPISIFDIDKVNPIEIQPGDEIKFYSISLMEFAEIEASFKNGFYNLKKVVLND
ncbi:5-oxoprolinase subunit PxpB [Lutibacter flavus]|uniref:Inhibitor of KinA n=1 Tax=Lutibacter flavus TaxID=691689 RepID=A0A238VJ29_9FLAO|nr:5-oxoprolinase subunit PxpB [Lutibacter flavus]SNR34402.1 inhibitor of KinA [Lutibacter flavus]